MAHRGVVRILEAKEHMRKFSEWHFISKMLNNMQVLSKRGLVLCDQDKDLRLNALLENEISEGGKERK